MSPVGERERREDSQPSIRSCGKDGPTGKNTYKIGGNHTGQSSFGIVGQSRPRTLSECSLPERDRQQHSAQYKEDRDSQNPLVVKDGVPHEILRIELDARVVKEDPQARDGAQTVGS